VYLIAAGSKVPLATVASAMVSSIVTAAAALGANIRKTAQLDSIE
jgi:hypothetical protein